MHIIRLMIVWAAVVWRTATVADAATPLEYGRNRLRDALGPDAEVTEVNVQIDASLAPPEGCVIKHVDGKILVSAGDQRGALYGLLEIEESVRGGAELSDIPSKSIQPKVSFRALKFNLPFAAYRNAPVQEQHQETCMDLRFWRAFLDMMAENRFNALTLWSMHPFHYLTVPKSFPEAQTFTGEQMQEYRELFTGIFALAKERGIDTYLINWNIFVSPAFARAHGVAEYSIGERHIGDGAKDRIIEQYTLECVQQTIDEYPDLTGLGVSLGERMGGMSPDERRDWLEAAVFSGIRAASRPIRFIYRAPFSADLRSGGTTSAENDQKTRRQIESVENNIARPVLVELKFNWSHGHSSPELFIVHGGRLSDAYWNPPSDKLGVVWTVRNEDFVVLRWGDPDFIRDFIGRNTQPYVSGVIVGSETYIPAKDFISIDGPWKAGRYAFERQWLFYALWGRLLYEPATPDTLFAAMLGRRFGEAHAMDLLEAWRLASRAPLRFASFHRGLYDGTLYTEGFASWVEGGAGPKFFDVDEFIGAPVLDAKYVNVRDYVEADRRISADKVSPLELADTLERDAARAEQLIGHVRARGGVGHKLEAELADIDAWIAFGRYLTAKIRGAVALQTYRKGGGVQSGERAVSELTLAVGHWKTLADHATRFNKSDVAFQTFGPMSWKRMLPAVEHDVTIARNSLKSRP